MSFTYDPSLSSWRDHARLALGDVDPASGLLQDETIEAKLEEFGYLEAVAQLADGLAVLASQDPTKYAEGSVGLSAEWTERVQAWRKLADDCRSGRIAVPVGSQLRSGIAVGELAAPTLRRFRPD